MIFAVFFLTKASNSDFQVKEIPELSWFEESLLREEEEEKEEKKAVKQEKNILEGQSYLMIVASPLHETRTCDM